MTSIINDSAAVQLLSARCGSSHRRASVKVSGYRLRTGGSGQKVACGVYNIRLYIYSRCTLSVDCTLADIVRCLSGLNVHSCKKLPKLAKMTFDRYLSNPDIGRTFWDGLIPPN